MRYAIAIYAAAVFPMLGCTTLEVAGVSLMVGASLCIKQA